VPEVLGFAQLFVLATAGQVAAEEEVGEGVFVQHPVNAHVAFDDAEVDAVVTGAAAVKFFAATLQDAVAFGEDRFVDVGGLDVQRLQQVKLGLCWEL
jgi:hypothetical protein